MRKKKQQQQQQTNLVQIPEHGSPVIPPRDKSIKPAIPKRTVALPVVVTRNIDVHEQVRAFLIPSKITPSAPQANHGHERNADHGRDHRILEQAASQDGLHVLRKLTEVSDLIVMLAE